MVASKGTSANSSQAAADGAKPKVKSPFGGSAKKRKPARPAQERRQNGSFSLATATAGAAAGAGIASAVKTKPSQKQRSSESLSGQNSRQDSSDSRRDAQLVVSRVEPWSVMKFSFIISLVGWIVVFVAVALLYYALRAFGVFHYLEQTFSIVTKSKGNPGSNASDWFSASTVLGYTMLAGAINVVLLTALATVGAVIYNIVTHISGGVEVTLREAD
jgi:hypothetical protein